MQSYSSSGYAAVPNYPPPDPPSSKPPPESSSLPPSSGYATIPTYPTPPQPLPVSKAPPESSLPLSAAALPTATPDARVSSLITQFKEQGKALIATQRPWPQVLDASALGLPASSGDALSRVRRNLAYFRSNYALAGLAVFGIALLWHPVSLFVFLALCAAWFFLYFSLDEPLVISNRQIKDSTVLAALCIATVSSLIFTDVGSSVFGAVSVGVLLIGLHAAFRKTDDLYLDESEAASGGLVAGFGVPGNGTPNQIYVDKLKLLLRIGVGVFVLLSQLL